MILEYINQTWTVLVLYSTWRAGHLVVRLKHSIHTHYNLSGGNAAAHYCVFILSITQRTREQTCTHVKSSLLLLEFRGRGQFSGQGHLNSRRELRLALDLRSYSASLREIKCQLNQNLNLNAVQSTTHFVFCSWVQLQLLWNRFLNNVELRAQKWIMTSLLNPWAMTDRHSFFF